MEAVLQEVLGREAGGHLLPVLLGLPPPAVEGALGDAVALTEVGVAEARFPVEQLQGLGERGQWGQGSGSRGQAGAGTFSLHLLQPHHGGKVLVAEELAGEGLAGPHDVQRGGHVVAAAGPDDAVKVWPDRSEHILTFLIYR